MNVLLAATTAGIARAGRAGGSWSAERHLEGQDVRCLATDGSSVFAGTARDGVFRSGDGGATWEYAGLSGERVRSLAAADGSVYAGTREPRILVTRDRGESWHPLARFPRRRSWWWVQPAEEPHRPSYVSAVAVTPEGAILAGIEACAVLRSEDGGRTWSGHRRRALRDCHELHVVAGRVYEAGSGGLAVSGDDGRTWHRPRAGLDRRYGWSVAIADAAIYLTVAPYLAAHSGNSRACVFRWRGRGPWERCTDELSSLPRLRATAEGDVLAALGDGTVLSSTDEGESWERLPVETGGAANALLALQ